MKTHTSDTPSKVVQKWLCFQIGAREDYVVPRALKTRGMLGELITDVWATPGSWISRGTNGLSARYHSDLANAPVTASNYGALRFEIGSRARGRDGWNRIIERNDWFQSFAIAHLNRHRSKWEKERPIVFAYSYAALQIFKFARGLGWKTVLGQIDPGRADERLVSQLHNEPSAVDHDWQPAPPRYWDQWSLECDLADQILVNSTWTQDALLNEGVPTERIKVVPLAIERFPDAAKFTRQYPIKFTPERPLRVLFLGQINLRKGVGVLFEAIRLVQDLPLEFWFVGPCQVSLPEDLRGDQRIKWIGAVARNNVAEYYRTADVFILPTLSDGFGLTQLEAQCWKLPVVASTKCGRVVRHGENGLLLEEISAHAIADSLRRLVRSPNELQAMAVASGVAEQFTLKSLASSLLTL
ncbi:MAG TPA: glycosyltransferase family 4 protein [Pyrinomonadaceae bacterium]